MLLHNVFQSNGLKRMDVKEAYTKVIWKHMYYIDLLLAPCGVSLVLLHVDVDGIVDPEYLEFLEFIAKPVENLPSAEIQLERRDAERAG